MYRIIIALSLFFAIFYTSCGTTAKKDYIKEIVEEPVRVQEYDQIVMRAQPRGKVGNFCNDILSYTPNPDHPNHTPLKRVRINFHVMRRADGTGNFSKTNGDNLIKEVLDVANSKLRNNKKMNLPLGNDTPVVPINYTYELTGDPNNPKDNGIYYHDDDELYFITASGKGQNNYIKDVFKKYAIQPDSVLNIFIMSFHADSLASKTFKPQTVGIGFRNFCKIATWYYKLEKASKSKDPKAFSKVRLTAMRHLHHEIGHSLGLAHSWRGNDGCDDTPNNPNCWNFNKKKKGTACDSLVSNNIMDYNAHRSAWSPCQIGKIHKLLHDKKNRARGYLVKTWCNYDKNKTITIEDEIFWEGARDLEGDLVIENGGSLMIHCSVSLPKGAKIIVKPKGKLILNGGTLENDCSQKWKGIEVWEAGGNKGEVIIQEESVIQNVENNINIKERS